MIEYNTTEDPTEIGVYACRYEDPDFPYVLRDIFLIWYSGKWERLGSDQRFRDRVRGWVGPLRRGLK